MYPVLRSTVSKTAVRRLTPVRFAQLQARSTAQPVSKSAIIDLPERWETMSANEQQALVSQLAERQKLPWKELTNDEKQAAWYISYGEWGPRRPVLQKGDGLYILKGVIFGLAASLGLFAYIRSKAEGPVVSMNKEWQMKSDEYLRSKHANPWGGYSQVQSK